MSFLCEKFKAMNGLQKRGIIYIGIAVIMIAGEFIWCSCPRTVVLLLWFGVLAIGLVVLTVFKSREQ